MGRESPLTRIPGAWADRHPVLASALICAVFAAFVIAIASTAHARDAAPEMDWIPLSPKEITDAQPCDVKYVLGSGYLDELAVCAGEKKIGTGIFVLDKRLGKSLDGEVKWETAPGLGEAFVMTTVTTVRQTAHYPEWEFSFYVLSGQQLDAIIERARRDPQWKPDHR